jgi:hypothetical protein
MRWRAVLVFVTAMPVVALGCEQLIGATFDVTTDDCHPVRPPGPPATQPAGTLTFAVAAHDINFGDMPDGSLNESLGYDLDGLCTLRGQGPPCHTPTWTEAGVMRDGINGRDNAIGRFTALQQQLFGVQAFSTVAFSQAIGADLDSPPVMLRISSYGGFSDSAATVDWVWPVNPPGGDAGSRWTALDDAGLASFDYVQSWKADEAYVSQGQLVARFHKGPPLLIANVPMPTSFVTVSGQIVGTTMPNGVDVSGWVTVGTMFATLPYFTKIINHSTACLDNPAYPSIKKLFCGFADMLDDGGVSTSSDCDGLSFAVHVTMQNIDIGSQVAQTIPPVCSPMTDPAGDTCAHP